MVKLDDVSYSAILDGHQLDRGYEVVSHELSDFFPQSPESSMVVNVEIVEIIWVLSPQPLLVVTLIIFRVVKVDVMEVREVLPHQVLQDVDKDQSFGLAWVELNAFLENSPSLHQNTEYIFHDPASSRKPVVGDLLPMCESHHTTSRLGT